MLMVMGVIITNGWRGRQQKSNKYSESRRTNIRGRYDNSNDKQPTHVSTYEQYMENETEKEDVIENEVEVKSFDVDVGDWEKFYPTKKEWRSSMYKSAYTESRRTTA